MAIKLLPQFGDQAGQWIVEIAVLIFAKAIAGHFDGIAETLILAVEARQFIAFFGTEQRCCPARSPLSIRAAIRFQSRSATRSVFECLVPFF